MDKKPSIGGTIISAICGVNPYVTPFQAWLKLTGQAEQKEVSEAMDLGIQLEAPLAKQYADKHGMELAITDSEEGKPWLVKSVQTKNTKYPQFHHNADYECPARKEIVSIKTCGLTSWSGSDVIKQYGEEGTDQVPQQHIFQENWYMLPGSLDWAQSAALFALIAGRGRVEFRIPRDPELQEMMIDAALKFMTDYVEPMKAPELTEKDFEPFAAHGTRKYPNHNENILTAPPEVAELLNNYAEISMLAKKYETDKELLKTNLCSIVGPDQGVQSDLYRFTWKKTKDGEETDWEGLAKELLADLTTSGRMPKDVSYNIIARFTKAKPGVRRALLKELK